ncbi:hypothetical protein HDU92_000044 [Lobulomyces angularis]|nr:hypothetical protein HDU92_000044 [Lobulomyces angularis]
MSVSSSDLDQVSFLQDDNKSNYQSDLKEGDAVSIHMHSSDDTPNNYETDFAHFDRNGPLKQTEQTIAKLTKDNFNLKLRIYFLEERINASVNKNLIEETMELKSLLNSQESEINNYLKENSYLNQKNREFEENFYLAIDELEKLKRMNERYKEENELMLEDQKESAQKAIAVLIEKKDLILINDENMEKVEALSKENAKLCLNLEEACKEKKLVEESFLSLNSKFDVTLNELQEKTNFLVEVERKNVNLCAEIESSRKELESVNFKVSEFAEKNSRLQAENNKLLSEITEKAEECQILKDENSELTKKLKLESENQSKALKGLQENFESKWSDKLDEIKNLEQKNEEYKNAISKLNDGESIFQQKIKQLTAELENSKTIYDDLTSDNNSLKLENAAILKKNDTAETKLKLNLNELEKCKSVSMELKNKNYKINFNNGQLNNDLDLLREEICKRNEMHERLVKEKGEVDFEKQNLETRVKCLEEQLVMRNGSISDLHQQVVQLEKEIQENDTKFQYISKEISRKNEEIIAKDELICDYKLNISRYLERIGVLESNIEKTASDVINTNEGLKIRFEERKAFELEIANLNSELLTREKEIGRLKNSNASLNRDLESYLEENDILQEKINLLSTKLQDNENAKNSLNNLLEEYVSKSKKREENETQLKAEAEKQLLDCEQKICDIQNRNATDLKLLVESNGELVQKISLLEEEIDTLQHEKKHLTLQIGDLMNDLCSSNSLLAEKENNFKDTTDSAKLRISELQNEKDELSKSIFELNEKVELLKKEKGDMETEYFTVNKEVMELKEQLSESTQKNSEISAEINAMMLKNQAESNAGRENLESLNQTVEDLRSCNNALSSKVESLTLKSQEFAKLEKDFDTVSVEKANLIKDLETKHFMELNSVQQNLERLNEELVKSQLSYQDLKNEFNNLQSLNSTEIQRLLGELKLMTEQVNLLESENKNLLDELNTLKASQLQVYFMLMMYCHANNAKEKNISSNEVNNLAAQLELIESEKGLLLANIDSLNSQLFVEREHWTTSKVEMEEKLSFLESKNCDILTKNENQKVEYETVIQELNQLKSESKASVREMHILEEELIMLKLSKAEAETDFKNKIQVISSQLDEAKEAKLQADVELNSKNRELKKLREEIENLSKLMDVLKSSGSDSEKLDQKLKLLEQQLASKEQEICCLESKLKTEGNIKKKMEIYHKTLKESIKNSEEEIAGLKTSNTLLEEQLQKLANEISYIQNNNAELKAEVVEKESAFVLLTESYDELYSQNSKLIKENEDLEFFKMKNEASIPDLKAKVDLLQSEIKSLNGIIIDHVNCLNQKNVLLEEKAAELNKANDAFNEHVSNLEAKLSNIDNMRMQENEINSELKMNLKNFEDEILEKSKEMHTEKKSVEICNAEILQLKNLLDDKDIDLLKEAESVRELQSKLDKNVIEVEELKNLLAARDLEINEKKNLIADFELNSFQKKSLLEDLETINERRISEIGSLEEKLIQKDEAEKTLKESYRKLELNLGTLQLELEKEKDKTHSVAEKQFEVIDELKKKLSAVENENFLLTESIKTFITDKDASKLELTQITAEYKNQSEVLNSMQNQLSLQKKELALKKKEITHLEGQLSSVLSQLKDITKQLNENIQRNALRSAEEQEKVLQFIDSKLSDILGIPIERNSAENLTKSHIEAKLNSLTELRESFCSKVLNLQQQMLDEKKIWEDIFKKYEKKCNSWNQGLNDVKLNVKELKREKSNLKKEKFLLNKENAELKMEISEKEKAISEQKSQFLILKNKFKETSAKISNSGGGLITSDDVIYIREENLKQVKNYELEISTLKNQALIEKEGAEERVKELLKENRELINKNELCKRKINFLEEIRKNSLPELSNNSFHNDSHLLQNEKLKQDLTQRDMKLQQLESKIEQFTKQATKLIKESEKLKQQLKRRDKLSNFVNNTITQFQGLYLRKDKINEALFNEKAQMLHMNFVKYGEKLNQDILKSAIEVK